MDILGTLFIIFVVVGLYLFIRSRINTITYVPFDFELYQEQLDTPIDCTIEESGQMEIAAYERAQRSKIGL